VSASADSGSSIAPSGSASVTAGGSVTFSFVAKPGYVIADVVIDGASVLSAVDSGSYTFSGADSNHTISVTSKPFVPASGDNDGNGSGDGKDGSDGNGSGDGSGDGLFSGATAVLAAAAVAVAAAAGSAVFWFAFGPGRTLEVIKVSSRVPITGKDKARYRKAYRFGVEGGTNVKYRTGTGGSWKAPLRTGDGYEIPKEDVTATITIETD
jgi:hypothetical protein